MGRWFVALVIFFITSLALVISIGGDFKGWSNYTTVNKVFIVIFIIIDIIAWLYLVACWRGR